MRGVAGKSGRGEADETRSVMPGYQSVWIRVWLMLQDVVENVVAGFTHFTIPLFRETSQYLMYVFQSCLQEWCHVRVMATAVTSEQALGLIPSPLCVELTCSPRVCSAFFLQSVNMRWTGECLWCTGGLFRVHSRLLPSDRWDRLQCHLWPRSEISRKTENNRLHTCMKEINRRLSGSWLVVETQRWVCFLQFGP